MENNYSVYQHVTPDGMYYFGQTSNIKRRWKNNGAEYKGTTLQPYIEKFGWNNIQHIVLFKDQTKEDALFIENFLIETAREDGVCINKNRSGNVSKEEGYKQDYDKHYYKKNKDKKKQYYEQNKDKRKDYLEQNKDKIREYNREYQREYQEQNKEQIREQKKQYYERNKEKFKEYREQNKEQIREYQRQYQREYKEQNKDKIREYNREYHRQYRKRKKLEKQLKEVETTLF